MLKRTILSIAIASVTVLPAAFPASVSATTNESALSCNGSALSVPVDTWGTGNKGQEKVLANKDVKNGEYELTVISKNQDSVHPNTDMIVRSGANQVEVKDVEAKAFQSGKAEGTLKVSDGKVTLLVRIGQDAVYSGGMDVCLHEVKQPEQPKECKPGITVGDARCEEKQCPVHGKENLKSTDDSCEETPVAPAVTELPKTGPGQFIAGSIIVSLIATGAFYLHLSRRAVSETVFNR